MIQELHSRTDLAGAIDGLSDPERVLRVGLQERMNSPLQDRKVRLRGLGGPAVCGVPGTGASAPREAFVARRRSRSAGRTVRACVAGALAAGLSGCAARLAPHDAQRLGDVLFAPPTRAEMCAVEAEWARRDTRAHDARVEWSDEGRGGRTMVLSHTVDGVRHYGAVRIPPGAKGRRLPVLVITHGGDKGTSAYNFVRTGPISEGWIQVLPSYRSERLIVRPLRRYRSEGRPSPWDRDVDDAMALLSTTLQQVPEADTARIAVFGRSRGGGVALLMAIRDPRVKGVVDYFGPTDFYLPEVRHLADRALRSRIPRLPGAGYLADSVLFALRDGRTTVERARSELLRRSPVYFAHRLPPTQIHHGTADDEVPIVHSRRLSDAFTGLGRPGPLWEMVIYPGGGHRPHTLAGAPQRVADWLQRVVASGAAPPRSTSPSTC